MYVVMAYSCTMAFLAQKIQYESTRRLIEGDIIASAAIRTACVITYSLSRQVPCVQTCSTVITLSSGIHPLCSLHNVLKWVCCVKEGQIKCLLYSNNMRTLKLPPPQRVALRARAVHRLAQKKRWPAYVFAAIVQETPHEVHDNPTASLAIKAAHIWLTYLSFTLLDP